MSLNTINNFLSKDKHTRNIQINTFLIMLLRGAGILCNLLLIPITLNYLDKVNYGVWLTLTSIIAWVSFMDVGLGNGMRNKLAEAIAADNKILAKQYVSTTYILFGFLISSLLVLFSIVNPFLSWNNILRTNLPSSDLLLLSFVVVFSFCLRLVLDLAGIIVISLHEPFKKSFIDFLFNGFTLLFVYILTLSGTRSFLLFGAIVSLVPIFILIIFTVLLFRKKSKYNYLRPSFQSFKKEHIKSLFNLGIQFFVIQIAALIVFSTDNILII